MLRCEILLEDRIKSMSIYIKGYYSTCRLVRLLPVIHIRNTHRTYTNSNDDRKTFTPGLIENKRTCHIVISDY